MIKQIQTDKTPKAIGPYSQAIVANGFVFCSGQIGLDPKNGTLVEGLENQTRQVLNNLKEVLSAADSSLQSVVKTSVYITNMTDFQVVNTIYDEFFAKNKPARSTVEVSSLPKGALIEIDAMAIMADK